MKNWGIDWAWLRDSNAFWDTQVRGQVVTHPRPPPVQSVRARTGRGKCVRVCEFVAFLSAVCPCWPTESSSNYSQRQREVCVCVGAHVCVCPRLAESHRGGWHGIFYTSCRAGAWLTSDAARWGVRLLSGHTVTLKSSFHILFLLWTMFVYPQCRRHGKEMMQEYWCPLHEMMLF